MKAEAERLRELPRQLTLLGRDAQAFQGRLLQLSSAAARKRILPACLSLSSLDLKLRLYLARDRGKIVFFFFRKKKGTEVLLDTDLQARVRPRMRERAPERRPLRFSVVRPPFIRRAPEEVRTLALEATALAEPVVFALGPRREDRLVISNSRGSARVFYRCGGVTEQIRPDLDGNWPLDPFLALLDEIRRWIHQGIDSGQPLPVPAIRVGEPSVQEIVDAMVECYTTLKAAFEQEARSPLSLELSDFTSRVMLRVTPEGTIAEDEFDPFQLVFLMRELPGAESDELRVSVGPPDFLVSGEMFTAFREALVGKQLPTLRAHVDFRLRRKGIFVTLKEMTAFVESAFAGRQVSVFRVQRGKLDTDILVLRGPFRGVSTVLVFSARFEVVKTPSKREVSLRKDFQLLHFGPGGEEARIGHEFVKFFFRLAAALQTWTQLT